MSNRVVCVTCDKYLWAARPFAYLFDQYWPGQEALIAGFSIPDFDLPPSVRFHQIDPVNYPPEKWSNGMIKLLNDLPNDDIITILLEDYWLIRDVDVRFMALAEAFMRENPNILKIDLTTDRLHARGDARDALDFWSLVSYDIIITPSEIPYRMSLQAAMWNRSLLLKLLTPDKSPWQFEIEINPPEEMLVLGTRQWPIRYCNAIYKGKLDEKALLELPSRHMKVVRPWIPDKLEKRE